MDEKLEQLIGWLEAGPEADYQAGVLLLQKYGSNRSLVNLLLKKESVANRDKLRYELVKLGCGGRLEDVSEVLSHFAQAMVGAVPVVQQVADVLTSSEFAAAPEPEHMPEELRAQADELTQRLSKLYNQRCQLSNSLADLSEEEAPGVVGEILRLEQQYNELAQQRRTLANPPEQPAPEQSEPLTDGDVVQLPVNTALPLDRAELVKQRSNLRSNLSKAKKKAEEAKTEDKRSEYSQKAGKLEVELGLVESQLALPQA